MTPAEPLRRFRRRVPVVTQMTATDCGAACLAMVLGFHGRTTPLADCREALGTGRDGANAAALARVGRAMGLQVKAYTVELDALPLVPTPAVAHWNFDHFVVVERWTDDGAWIVDPATGRRRVGVDEFSRAFTGIILAMEPGAGFHPARGRTDAPRRRLVADLFRAPGIRGVLAQVIGASLVLQLLGLALPVLTKVVVDGVVPFGAGDVLPMLGAGMAVVVAAQATTGYLRGSLLVYLQGRLDARLMVGFWDHLLSLPFRFFQERTSGDLLQRLSSNLVLREVLSAQGVSLLLDGVFVLVYLLLLAFLSPPFAAVALLLGGLQVGVMLAATGRVHEVMQRELAAQADASSYAVEALKGVALLKATGTEARALDRWSDLYHRQLNVSLERGHLAAVLDTALGALRTASPLGVLWLGAHLVLDGRMSLGTMLALNAMTVAFLTPIASLVSSGQRLQLVGAHLDRILDVLSAAPEQPAGALPPPAELRGAVELRGVSFRYTPDAPLVLHDVSLRVEPGAKVALVGPTGSGKSTLAALLLALYEPTAGEVLFDGRPARSMHLPTLRSRFGVVMQEPFLFSGSIRRNVAFHAPDLPLERVVEAARLAAVHDDVAAMPMGYETPLGEGGGGLSGGQRQRLAIARALAAGPAVLLLDEATSHLDAVTEEQVDRNLEGLACTRVVIAHRLSTVRNADLIVVVDGGRIVEQGTHDELVARGGAYAALVDAQGGPALARA